MKGIRRILALMALIMVAITPAQSGGYWEGSYYHKLSDNKTLTEAYTRNLVSGLSFGAVMNISLKYKTDCENDGIFPAEYWANYWANQTAEGDVYYSRVKSNVTQTILKDCDNLSVREVLAETYIIMPKKFDADQAIHMNFSDMNGSVAQVRASFTYDGNPYEFSVESGINESETLKLFLYPYCPFFEGLDLDYENIYTDPLAGPGFDYEGSFVRRALKG